MVMNYANEGRVLLLDDERLVRFTISAWLKATRFEVTAVATPAEAILELKYRSYDVILSDVMMDDVDGFMFRDKVRGFNTEIPIVFLTALVNSPKNRLLEKVAEDPNSYYVAKNSRRDNLLWHLRQAVMAYRATREVKSLKDQVEADLHVAARVQHALLPPLTRYWKNIFYSGLWRPQSIVSGDLFCWYPLSDHSAVVISGDIAGHGTPAALAMMAVLTHIKKLGHSEGVMTCRPDLVCQEIDAYVRRNLRDVTYVAGTVLFVNMRKHVVRYLNAGGMEPLCFRRSDGSCIDLNPQRRGGLPMGLMDGTVYTADDIVETPIPDDALICLYTDGFVDLTTDAAGEERMSRDVFNEIIGEFVRGASGTSDVASIPYRLTAVLKDMGYMHAQDDESFCLIGAPFTNEVRFLETVPMDDANSVNGVVDRASHWALTRGYSDELVSRLERLLQEHLENVRKHCLEGRSREEVVIEMRPMAGELEILVWDQGLVCEGDLSESAPQICHRVTYNRFDTLNKFTFVLGESADRI